MQRETDLSHSALPVVDVDFARLRWSEGISVLLIV